MSAAEMHPGPGVAQLDFFDALERRDLVSHDDTIHAVLLLFTGQSGQTYSQRAGRAKQLGLLDPKFDRPAREAATVGELAQLLASGMHRPSAAQGAEATTDMISIGVLPDTAAEGSGVTGIQFLTILAHAEDALALNRSPGADAATQPLSDADLARVDLAIYAQQPVGRDKKPVKKPPIDLEDDARKPRPGQVLPDGTPTPAPTAPSPSAPVTPGDTTPAPPPAPPPRLERISPERLEAIASELRYVAVDKVNLDVGEVLGPGEFVQWRAIDDGRGRPGAWETLQSGEKVDERVEIRTGLSVRATFTVNESTTIVLHRLSRVRIERKIRSDGGSQLGITLFRGMAEITATNEEGGDVLVKTPDQTFPLRSRALFEYDAFLGTVAREFRR